MARILIPTRNRPTSLMAVMSFLNKFYPDTKVIVADGSADEFADLNRTNMSAEHHQIEIDYRRYDYDLPFFDRLIEVLSGETDDYFIMGSDDDFPFLDVLKRAEGILDKDSDAVVSMGAMIHMFLKANDHLQVRLGLARNIKHDQALARARNFSAWPYSTTYAVARREHLIERYKRAKELFLVGFFDFAVGMHDSCSGKILTLPEFSFIGTRNYNHSYLRAAPGLVFLDRAGDVKKVIAQIATDLMRTANICEAEAVSAAHNFIKPRIAELTGAPAFKMEGFIQKPIYKNRVVEAQVSQFEEIFTGAPSAARSELLDRLEFITAKILDNAQSQDNHGESHTISTLEAQMQAGRETKAPVEATTADQKRNYRNRKNSLIPFRMVGAVNPANLEWYPLSDD